MDDDPLKKMHELLMEALRARESEIFQYLTILGPALAGFAWLLYEDDNLAHRTPPGAVNAGFFIAVTVAVMLLLVLGAMYALSLGYNYRYFVLELAKLESRLNLGTAVLRGWPQSPQDFIDRYTLLCVPWCTPPSVIKVFWYAFLAAIGGVALTASLWRGSESVKLAIPMWTIFVLVGAVSLVVPLLSPVRFGCKLRKLAQKEEKAFKAGEWSPQADRGNERAEASSDL